MSNTPIKAALDEVKDMHYKYTNIIISGDLPAIDMTDEERRFFNLTKAFPGNIMSAEDVDTQKLRAYVLTIVDALLKSYLNLYGKNSALASTLSQSSSWSDFKTDLEAIKKDIRNKAFLQLLLIGNALLFLLRTSRRALFIYKSNIESNQKEQNVPVANGLISVFEYLHRYIDSVNNLSSSNFSADAKKVAALEFELKTLKDQKFTERVIAEAKVQTKPILSVATKLRGLLDKYAKGFASATAEQKTKMLRSLEVFLDRSTGTYTLKPNVLEEVSNSLYLFKEFFQMQCEEKKLLSNPEYLRIVAYLINKRGVSFLPECVKSVASIPDVFGKITESELKVRIIPYESLYILLVCIQSVLDASIMDAVLYYQRTNDKSIFENFFPGKPIYSILLNIYERMTGSVRVIVKLREMYSISTHRLNVADFYEGGRQKTQKRKQRMYFGGMTEQYRITLDKGLRNVYMSGIEDIYNTFYSAKNVSRKPPYNRIEKQLDFGPFYNVLDKEKADHIVKDTLNYDIMKGTLLENKTNIVFYTYGYSGSGKTYSLFGKMNGRTDDGVVWSLISRLHNDGVDVKLASAKRLYGYLQNDGKYATFQDTVYDSELHKFNSGQINPADFEQRISTWQRIINKDLSVVSSTDAFVSPDSFIKPTSNNPSSSRGFYVLKFDVFEDNTKVSSIGVVDMAGNEDPYDILSSMSPTVRPEMLDKMMTTNADVIDIDVLYNEIYKNMVKFVEFIITTVYRVKYKGLEIEKLDLTEYSRIEHLGLLVHLGQEFNKLTRSSLSSTIIQASYSINDTARKPIRVELKDGVVSLSIDVYPRMLIEFLKLPLHSLASSVACGSKAYNMLMSMGVKALYTTSCKRENPQKMIQEQVQKWNTTPVSLNDIKQALIIYKNSLSSSTNEFDGLDMLNNINALLLRYTISQISSIYSTDLDTKVITTLSMKVQFPDRGIDVKPALAKISKSVQEGFAKCLRDDLAQNGYIIPVNIEGDIVRYKFPTIARIIQEGYYINKANAELVEYFARKSNFVPVHNIYQNNLKIIFKNAFELSNYDKFKYNLQEDNKNTYINFHTKLVPLLIESFGVETSSGQMTQDIMFACIRNDKEIGKALGAIDTLLLVQDLKST